MFTMQDRVKRIGLMVVALAAGAGAWWRHPAPHEDPAYSQAMWVSRVPVLSESQAPNSLTATPIQASRFISQSLSDFCHAASITELANGDLLAVWFSGSREGASDVQISQTRFDAATQTWQPVQALLTREKIVEQQQLFTGKLGNPVIATAPDGRLWFFVVAASYFGWGSSTVNVMVSDDQGATWSPVKRLQLTPFFNLSTLIRNAPAFYSDASIGLPVYRESAGKFPQWLRVDQQLNVLDQARVNGGRHNLQPATVAFGDQQLQMFMRSADSKRAQVFMAASQDGGRSWSAEQLAPVANPNSGLSAVPYDAQSMLVALNDVKKGRHQLSLYRVSNGDLKWTKLRELENTTVAGASGKMSFSELLPTLKRVVGENKNANPSLDLDQYIRHIENNNDRICGEKKTCEFYYDYPYLYRDSRDQFHVVYSWNKSFIKHQVFNRAALEVTP